MSQIPGRRYSDTPLPQCSSLLNDIVSSVQSSAAAADLYEQQHTAGTSSHAAQAVERRSGNRRGEQEGASTAAAGGGIGARGTRQRASFFGPLLHLLRSAPLLLPRGLTRMPRTSESTARGRHLGVVLLIQSSRQTSQAHSCFVLLEHAYVEVMK